MIKVTLPTSYPPPPARQPAIEGAQSVGRPWITLRWCLESAFKTPTGIDHAEMTGDPYFSLTHPLRSNVFAMPLLRNSRKEATWQKAMQNGKQTIVRDT